jgi:hypothetical protein
VIAQGDWTKSAVDFCVSFAREQLFLQARSHPLKYALDLHGRPHTATARRWNALLVKPGCDGPQACCAGRL